MSLNAVTPGSDFITRAIFDVNIPFLTDISAALDPLTYIIIFLAWIYLAFSNTKDGKNRAKVVFLSFVLILGLVPFLKSTLDVPRPCNFVEGKIPCPDTGSFPSGHAALTAIMIPAFLGTTLFIPYLGFNILVLISRVHLGVHSTPDVIAGAIIGIAAFYGIWALLISYKKYVAPSKETKTR